MPSFEFERQSFQEAIAHFRQKTNVPTDRWDDIAAEEHDVAFVVAGAAKADLLADLRQAVDKAVTEGKTRKEFAQEFDQVLERTGWKPRGDKAWRSDVIFQTNVRSAHAAGRWEQLNALKETRPFWQWVHGDSVRPRPAHLALHRKIFPADSVFWQSMFPPQGFGCKCTVVSLSREEVAIDGLTVEDAPEVGSRLETVDRAGVPQFVKIEPAPGFGVPPGASRQEQRAAILQQVRERLPEDLRRELDRELESQQQKQIPWRPVMTEKDAQEYVKDSAYQQLFYHGTSASKAQSLKEQGFSLEGSETDSLAYGAGFYFAGEEAGASQYANSADPAILKGRLKVQNPKVFESSSEFWQFVDDIDVPFDDSMNEEISRKVKAQGFDGIVISNPGYFVVFDREQIVIQE